MEQENNNQPDQSDTVEELWSNSLTAQFLAEQLPGRNSERWYLWIRNNRNNSRSAAYRVPFVRISNGTFYRPADVHKFIAWEKARQLGTMKMSSRTLQAMQAFGVGQPNGSSTGRSLQVLALTAQSDPITGDHFVRFVTDEPLTVYRLSPEEAKSLGQQLVDVATQTTGG
jgi:hypothetical protein